MISVIINTKNISGFESISVSSDINNISGSFNLTVSGQEFAKVGLVRILLQNTIQFKINNESILNGFVEGVDASGSETSHRLSFTGRDKTCDLLDSTFSKATDFTGTNSLVTIIKCVLSPTQLNIPGINVISNVPKGDIKDFETIEQASVGQGGFDFLNSLARLRQVILKTDGNGNIVLSRGETNNTGASLVWKLGTAAKDNNFLDYTFNGNTTNLFRLYIVKGQDNQANFSLDDKPVVESGDITDIDGSSEDLDVRASRNLTIIAETALKKEEASLRATWQNNFNKSQSVVSTVTVQGFSRSDGKLWKTGDLVAYVNENIDFQSILVISAITYNFSLSGGSKTTLTMLDAASYTLSITKPLDKQKAGKKGPALLDI